MSNKLILYFDPTLDHSVWVVDTGEEYSSATTVDLSALSEHCAEGSEAIAVIPGEAVISRELELPARSARHAAQAVPYLLEDSLAVPLEETHIVLGERTDNGILTAAISKAKLANYIDLLQEQGITLQAIITDYQLLTATEQPVCLKLSGRLLVRNTNGSGCTVAANAAAQLLPEALQSDTSWELLDPSLSPRNFCEWLVEGSQSASLNLLQGDFAPVQKHQRASILKPALTSLAATFMLAMVYLFAAAMYFSAETEQLNAEATELYRELFPEDKKILNIRTQMTGHLSRAGQQANEAEFMALLGKISAAYLEDKSDRSFRHLRYDRRQGAITLELQGKSMDSVNSFQQQLESQGAQVSVLSANRNDAGILARVRISHSSESNGNRHPSA